MLFFLVSIAGLSLTGTGNSPFPSVPGPIDNIEIREYGKLRRGFQPEATGVR
jgi:hypothetical protein